MEVKAREFLQIDDRARAAFLGAASCRHYDNNQFVYLQDDKAEALYLIVAGHIRLSYLMEDGSATLFAILPTGEIFGELGIFEGGRHCDMATAAGAARIASVSAGEFRALTARHPELGAALGRLVARRYRSYIELTRTLSLKTLSARLAQSLLRLADDLGDVAQIDGKSAPSIGPVVTQTDLGLMARGARGNVNRILKKWERAGLVALRDRRIVLLERQRLETLWAEEEI
jgi:CRP/FNR family transcriptional regulator, cyclic AMP receptor protein